MSLIHKRTAAVVAMLVVSAIIAAPAAAQTINPGTTSGNSIELSVANADSGSTFEIATDDMKDYLAAEDNADTNVEAIMMRLDSGGTFEMELSFRPGTDPSTPDIAGVEELTKINVSHPGLASNDIGEVTVRFAVRKERLESLNVGPEDVVFYQLQDDTWEEMNLVQTEERFDEYVFDAQLSQFSWLAVGAKQANFELINPHLNVGEIPEGQEATARVKVTNEGSTAGTTTLTATADDAVVGSQDVELSAGETTNVQIPIEFAEIGEYDVQINNQDAGTLRVVPGDASTGDDAADDGGDDAADGTDGNGSTNGTDDGEGTPGFTPVMALVAALAAAAWVRY